MDQADSSFSVLDVDRSGPCAMLSLAGQAGIADCGWLHRLLQLQAEQGPERLVVDLSRLSSMDWWVALILVWAGQVIHRRGGTLVLASPQPAVARLLNATAARQVAPVYVRSSRPPPSHRRAVRAGRPGMPTPRRAPGQG